MLPYKLFSWKKNELRKRKYQMNPIEKLILKETKGLPPFALNEVLDFIQFIKEKKLKKMMIHLKATWNLN
jgi:hypothetical protein